MLFPSRPSPAAILAALALATTTGLLIAGPLNPPAGPIAPSYRTLTEVEPRIAISATNTPGDANSLFRISQAGSYYLTGNLTGTAGKHGIEIASNDVTIDLNGFTLAGVPGSLSGITADNTVRHRVRVHNGGIAAWGSYGISLTIGSSSGMHIDRVRAAGNAADGIIVARDSHISACIAAQNGGSGIVAYYGTAIADYVATGNRGTGIDTQGACVISKSTARDNGQDGIAAFEDSVIEGCIAVANLNDGIWVGYDCVVRSNLCNDNGPGATVGAGIAVGQFLRGNRIEDNQVIGNDFGLKIDGDNNIIIRNTARANTSGNFSVVAGNEMAPVVTNPGSSNFSSATPWSNFAY